METSSWAHFKDNFTLNQKFKICNTLKWVLAPVLPHTKPEKIPKLENMNNGLYISTKSIKKCNDN